MVACKKKNDAITPDDVKPAPSINIDNSSDVIDVTAGDVVNLQVNLVAENGLANLSVLFNDAPSNDYPTILYNGDKSVSYGFKYTTQVNTTSQELKIKFIVTDKKNLKSEKLITIKIKVTLGVMFGADNNKKVFALSTQDGSKKWENTYTTFTSTPIYYKGVVYVTAEDQLRALNASDGTTRWATSKTLASFYYEPVMNDQLVYAVGEDVNGDNFLFALNLTDGTQKWKIRAYNPGNLSLKNGVLYYMGYDDVEGCAVWAVDATTGTRKWFYKVNCSFGNRIRVTNDVVYFTQYSGGSTGDIYAIDANNGSLKWKKTLSTGNWGAPVADANGVYIPASDKKIYALNLSDGSTKWTFATQGNAFTNLIVKDNVIYATAYQADKNFYAINANNGTEKWKYTESDYFSGWFVLSGNVIYAPNNNGKIYALNIANGQKIWEVSQNSYAYIGSVVDANNNVSYFGLQDM